MTLKDPAARPPPTPMLRRPALWWWPIDFEADPSRLADAEIRAALIAHQDKPALMAAVRSGAGR